MRTARRAALCAAVAAVTLYGGALRFEALVARYWAAQAAPGWALESAEAISRLHPRALRWFTKPNPYAGDPFGYLQYAREQRGFYDAHVREPLFVASARLGLFVADDADIGLNLASAFFGTLLVPATFLLARRVAPAWAALLAALAIAIEPRVIGLCVEGWRDDAFASLAALCAWALLGLLREPSRRWAAAAGVLGALCCLTRITSLAFLVPAWIFVAAFGAGPRRPRLRHLAGSVALTMLLLAPYLAACAVAFGDPFYSVNYHAQFYAQREAAGSAPAPGWVGLLLRGRQPMALAETLLQGLTSEPFGSKWRFAAWSSLAGPALAALSGVGLLAWLGRPQGRFLLLVLLGVLFPFALTWSIPGGGHWRFTLAAYPFYLAAAASLLGGLATWLRQGPAGWRAGARRTGLRLVGLGAAAALGLAGASLLHYLRVAEDLRLGKATLVEVGVRDALLLTDGWSWPRHQGRLWVRVARSGVGVVVLPLDAPRDLELLLRIAAGGGEVRVVLNGEPLLTLPGSQESELMPQHVLSLPGARLVSGRNHVELRSASGAELAFWYLRVQGVSPDAPPAPPPEPDE